MASYELTVVPKPGYLHCIVTGQNTLENVAGYLQDVVRECETRGCQRVLIEEALVGRRLQTWDVYKVAAEGSTRILGKFDAIAFVDVNARGELMKFAATVASNRGLPLNVFATVEEAEQWLAQKCK